MSAHRFGLALTKRAQRDVRGIQLYTLRQWGAEQALTYEAAIDRALETLRDHPRMGRARDDLRPGLFSFPAEHHVIYYRIKAGAIEVVRILHERADAARHLGPRRR